MSEIINPHDPNPIQMNKIPLKEGNQVDLNLALDKLGINVKVRIAYKGHLWKEDVGDIAVGFLIQDTNPPKSGVIIL